MKSVFNFIILILFFILLPLRFGEPGYSIVLLFITVFLMVVLIVIWFKFLITAFFRSIFGMYGLVPAGDIMGKGKENEKNVL